MWSHLIVELLLSALSEKAMEIMQVSGIVLFRPAVLRRLELRLNHLKSACVC